MGDLQVWAAQPNGPLSEESPSPSPFSSLSASASSSSSSNPHPLSIGEESWRRAEQVTKEIIHRIQPTVVSEQRRKAVVDYVQNLIRGVLGSEVFPFGSVPLKTYLPDGDIDLTAVSSQNVEDALANDVRAVLEVEEQNKAAEFEVKDVQYIHAEVKLVKCLVQNIVVDISFNQLGGLCTLCFLEQVDRFIGKDHLFKLSIILIKAWCYYESRILGAHHGLISTYALETLVLYIFHLFHSSLHGPLAVLYRFLDYYSKFDWDNYCISLNGPVAVSSLPEIVAETPKTDGGDVLLSKEFLRGCVGMFSVPSKGQESNLRSFPQKHLNIVDPLKENNNLGRSVSKGNFYRIRSAFTYGARKLGRILLLPGESIGDELNKFFMNTLDRHGNGQRPDVQDPAPNYRGNVLFDINGSGSVPLKTDGPKCLEQNTISGSRSTGSSGLKGEAKADHHGVLSEEINKIRISESERNPWTAMQSERKSYHQPAGDELQTYPKEASSSPMLESGCLTEGTVVSGRRMVGDAKDLATSQISDTRITSDTHRPFLPNGELGSLSFGKVCGVPHLYFSNQFQENGRISNGTPDQTKLKSSLPENKLCSTLQAPNDDVGLGSWQDPYEMESATSLTFESHTNHESSSIGNSAANFLVLSSEAYQSEDLYLRHHFSAMDDSSSCLDGNCGSSDVGFRERDLVSTGSPKALDGLSDLGGDSDNHFENLLYSRYCHEYIWSGPVLPILPPSPSQFCNKPSWDGFRQSPHWRRNMYPHMNANGVVPGSQFSPASGYYPLNSPAVSGAFVVEELLKPRGTGTYFPNVTNNRSLRDRNSRGRGRNPIPVFNTQLPRPRNNGRPITPPESLPDKGSHEPPQTQIPVVGENMHQKPSALEFVQPSRTAARGFTHANGGFSFPSQGLEFGSFRSVHLGAPDTEPGRKPDSNALQHSQGSGTMPTASTMPRPALGVKEDRVAKQTYHLKDEEDFPPLSV